MFQFIIFVYSMYLDRIDIRITNYEILGTQTGRRSSENSWRYFFLLFGFIFLVPTLFYGSMKISKPFGRFAEPAINLEKCHALKIRLLQIEQNSTEIAYSIAPRIGLDRLTVIPLNMRFFRV